MNLAITEHAVSRYTERVRGAQGVDKEEIRDAIRHHIEVADAKGLIKDHPTSPDQKLAPFNVNGEVFYACIAPNTTNYPGDKAVVSVIQSREHPEIRPLALGGYSDTKAEYKFIVQVRETGEVYPATDDVAVLDILKLKSLKPEQVQLYEKHKFRLKTVLEVD